VKTFFKIVLSVLVWTLIAALLIGGALMLDLSVEKAVMIFTGLFVAWYGFKLARWWWRRFQARQRVEQLVNVAPDERGLRKGVWRLWDRKNEKDERFEQVLQFLHSSRLRSHGDALYVLPWQLMLGDDASDKTAVLNSARLSRPTLDTPLLNAGPREINWHLYNRGIVIDTPSHFVQPEVEGSDEDWLRLLMQLEKHRREEPINGILINLSVPSLYSMSSEKIDKLAQKYRRLLEDVVQILGVRVPVNILLNHTEALPGFGAWAASLAPEQTSEALGAEYNGDIEVDQFALQLTKRIAARIREFNLLALRDQASTPDMLRLPARFQDLDRALAHFVSALFETNQFQEPQTLRGVYFSAEGIVAETALSTTDAEADVTPQTLFVTALFSRILPAQRGELEALSAAQQARLRKKRIQAVGWAAVVAGVAVAMSSLYWLDRAALHEAGRVYARQLNQAGDLDSRVSNLVAYQDLILRLEDSRFFPWLAPGTEPAFIARMKEDFANRVEAQLLEEVDRLFVERLDNTFFKDNTADLGKAAEYAGLLVRRINLLGAWLNGAGEMELSALPQAFDTETFANSDPESLEPLNKLYIRSMVWGRETHPDTQKDTVLAQRTQLQAKLDRVLSHAGADLSWMIAWANASSQLKSYKVSDFWKAGSGSVKQDVEVPRAFTLLGKTQIDGFVEELKQASGKDSLINEALPKFYDVYRVQYIKAWENFALSFSNGTTSLRTREEWLSVINNLSNGRNIYFNALNLVDNELAPYRDDAEVPEWVALSNYYQDMRALGPSDGTDNTKRNNFLTNLALKTIGKAGPVGKYISGAGTSALATKKKYDKAAGKASGGPTDAERAAQIEEATKLLQAYQTAIGEFVYNAEVRSSSYAATTALFNDPENPAKGGTPYAAAFDSVQKLQAIMGKETYANVAFWKLYKAPLDLIRGFMLQEASCQLDDAWRNTVLAELEGLPDFKRDDYLRGESGILWTFMSGTAAPFVRQELGKGFIMRRAQGSALNIDHNFLTFVARAKETRKAASTVNVEVKAYPSSLNGDAKTVISKSALTVSCPEASYDLHNYNYPINRRFPWTTACTGVNLELNLSSLTMTKSWQGPTAFPDFIKTFGGGPRSFTPNDFPEFSGQLSELGVKEIRLQFDVQGAGQVLQSVATTPLNIPQHAAACWIL